MSEKTITIHTGDSLPDVVGRIRKGEWKIPRFQREFVWEKRKVVELLDSMYKEFPIGSFFLWVPPEEYAHYYKDIPELKIEPTGKHRTHFILDGQQRLTSLYVTARGLTADKFDYSNISFDLESEQFNVGPPDGIRNISVHQIINTGNYLNVYDRLSHDGKRIFMQVHSRLTKYPFPIVTIENKNIEQACKIFERINQGGKRLTIFDLVVAVTWDKEFELKKKIDEFNRGIGALFGKIDEEVFAETLSLIVHKQCTKAFQLKLTPEHVKGHWDAVKDAVGLSIQFLRTQLKVRNYVYLPYRDMIALIAYYFHECRQRQVEPDKHFLEEWFWKASFSNRYSGSSFTKIGEDRAMVFDAKLAGEQVDIAYPINLSPDKVESLNMGRSTALRNAVTLILIQKTPLSFQDNTPVDIEHDPISAFNDSEKHHVFPKAYLKTIGVKDKKATDLVANFCLIDSALNKMISSKAPSDYFRQFSERNSDLSSALKSHLIPEAQDSPVWTDDYSKFIAERSKLIYREIMERVGDFMARIEQQMTANPEKLIQRTERAIREKISTVLFDAQGENWWDTEGVIPEDVKSYVKEKFKKERANKPYLTDLDFNTMKLEQVNIMDYLKIIMRNWSQFADTFQSKHNLEKYFEGFSNLRNQIAHVKSIDPIEMKFGETSIAWLLRCLSQEEDKPQKTKPVRNSLFVNQLYEILKTRILALDENIDEKKKKHFTAFSIKGRFFNFVTLRFRKDHLLIRLVLEEQDLATGMAVEISPYSKKNKSKVQFRISTEAQIDDAVRLISKSYQRQSSKKSSKSDVKMWRLEFWNGFIARAKEANSDFQNLSATKYHWKGKSTGKKGLRYVVALHRASSEAQLYLDSENKELNKTRFALLQSKQQEIENAFGGKLTWDIMQTKRASRIAFEVEGGWNNKDRWDEIHLNLIQSMSRLQKALQPHIDELI